MRIRVLSLFILFITAIIILLFCFHLGRISVRTSLPKVTAPSTSSGAITPSEFNDEDLAKAIFAAEGGHKAKFLYGIRSVHYKNEAEAKRICLNTIRNNRIRFKNQSRYVDYLCFLASRYCPIGADNDTGTNKYWLKNVKFFLERNHANKN